MAKQLVIKNGHAFSKDVTFSSDSKELARNAILESACVCSPMQFFIDSDDEQMAKDIIEGIYDDDGKFDIGMGKEYVELAMANKHGDYEAFAGLFNMLKVAEIDNFTDIVKDIIKDIEIDRKAVSEEEKKAKQQKLNEADAKAKGKDADKDSKEAKSKEESKDGKDKAKDGDSKDKVLTDSEKAEAIQAAATTAAAKTVDQIVKDIKSDIKGSEDSEEFRKQFQQPGQQVVAEPNPAPVGFDASRFVNQQHQATIVTPQQMAPQGPTLTPTTPAQAMQNAANIAQNNVVHGKIDLNNSDLKDITRELEKNYKFIPGTHEFNRDNLKNLWHMAHQSPFIKEKMRELHSTCRPNNPQFIEIPMPSVEQGGDPNYSLAFKVASKDKDDILVLMDPTSISMPDGRPSYRMQVGRFGKPVEHHDGCDCDDCKAEASKEETVTPAKQQKTQSKKNKGKGKRK